MPASYADQYAILRFGSGPPLVTDADMALMKNSDASVRSWIRFLMVVVDTLSVFWLKRLCSFGVLAESFSFYLED